MVVPGDTREQALVPYEASTFCARSALVLSPHADDEVFGCGAALASLNQRGAAVLVLLVTDGADEEPDPAVRRKVAATREAESRTALGLLGGGDVESASLPDRGLWARLAEVEEAIERALLARTPELVFVPSPAEVHPDHRSVAKAFLNVARGRPDGAPVTRSLANATVAFFEVSQPIRPNFLLDATPFAARKEAAIAAFVSQNDGHDYPSYVRGLMAYRRMTLPRNVTAAEGYFVLSGAALRMCALPRLLGAMGPSEVWV